ncbi:MAG: EamA family transporter RarD [Actinomycetota bacterium]
MHGEANGKDQRVARGVEYAVAAYLLWGFLTVYWKQLDGFDAVELIAWRMVCASVVMAAVVTVHGSWSTMRAAFSSRSTLVRLAAAAVLLTLNWGSYVWAVVNDRVIETALGYFLAPLGTMAIGVLAFGETPTRAQRAAFVLASIAVVVLTVSYGRPPWVAAIIAITWSAYGAAKRTTSLGPVESLAGETFVVLVPATVGIIALSSSATSVVATATATEWLFVLGTGVVTAVPLMLFARAAQTVPFTLLGPLNLLVPVINFGLGWWWYGESMPTDRVMGFAFVWAALFVVTWDQLSARRRVAPAGATARGTVGV